MIAKRWIGYSEQSRTEAKETFGVKTYAKISNSRQALINGDLVAFADTLAAFGRAAAETEVQLMADPLLANSGLGPTLDDGKTLFHADRNNIGTSAAINVAALSEARKIMREHKVSTAQRRPLPTSSRRQIPSLNCTSST
ncbi:phage major capsid protein [Aquibium pacificus]|uniref:phage major capsid protein n=1 Tax=Aquibium pacificus TaxID=3153579 RepID=UPI004038FA0C